MVRLLLSIFIPLLNVVLCFFFFQAEDGIRDLVRSRGLGDVYKRQAARLAEAKQQWIQDPVSSHLERAKRYQMLRDLNAVSYTHLTLPTIYSV